MKSYNVLIPYTCLVSVRIQTNKDLQSDDQVLDEVMGTVDQMEPILEFRKDGKPFTEFDIVEGQYSKSIAVHGERATYVLEWNSLDPRSDAMNEPKPVAASMVVTCGDGDFVKVDRGDEQWCFVARRGPRGDTYGLSLCLYSNANGTDGVVFPSQACAFAKAIGSSNWDGMASQNQPKRRIDRPNNIPRDVVIAVFDAVGWPTSPKVG